MYEKLLCEAGKENIEVVYMPLKGRIKGLYCDKVIAINKNIETTAEKTCILAEELGHHYTTAGNILNQKKITNRKQERLARAWAYKRLVPLDKLIAAYRAGVKSRYELAEYLHITEQFLAAALNYYKSKYGIYCQIGNCYICFEPLGIIENLEIWHQDEKPAQNEAGFVVE
jgi:Zn-dependent peptidase ImmA (M78 family)